MAVIVSTLTFAGCADDVYDPEKGIHTDAKDNPLGEDFSAPDGFNWSMINSVNLNVEVKDEFNGKYQYLVEVFTSNPLNEAGISPIAVGLANKNKSYSAEINISKALTRLFIRQTDPNQRKEVYEYNVPENGGVLDCKLYYVPTETRAIARAIQSPGTSGWDNVKDPEYTEENYNVPSESASVSGNQLANGSIFVIKPGETYKGVLHCYGNSNASVYVQGTWDLDGATPQGINIVVFNGGRIIAPNTGFMVSDKSSLTVQTGGIVNCRYLSTATNVLIKNFGTIQANGIRSQYNDGQGFNTGTVLYNAAEAVVNVEENFHITDSEIFNHGTITVGGKIQTNDDKKCVIANYDKASITSDGLYGGATIVNNGFIEVNICKNSSEDALYNNCTFIVKKEFYFRNVMLNKGSITGGRNNPTDKEWLPVPYVESQTDATFTLINGSMIKAIKFKVLSGNVKFHAKNIQGNEDKSMIKVEDEINFTEPTHVQLLGNLVIEGKITGPNKDNPFQVNQSVNTGFDESKYTIETCGGIFNEGNPGGEPTDPTFPIEIGDSDIYTFVFEDNWPAYGDFDMNDLVLVMSKKNMDIDKNGIVTRLRMTLDLRAVGATKKLGACIRFVKLPQNIQLDKFTINGNGASFETGQNAATCALFTNAHNELWGGEYTNSEKRINTIDQPDKPFKKDTKEYNIIMEIPATANVKPEDLNINNLDIFIITAPASKQGKRTEIHVAGFAPTDLGGTHYFKSGNDDSSVEAGKYYLSKENLAWAVIIPQEFAWPKESKKITDVYDQFRPWITTGGQNNKTWYTFHKKGEVYPIENLSPLNK